MRRQRVLSLALVAAWALLTGSTVVHCSSGSDGFIGSLNTDGENQAPTADGLSLQAVVGIPVSAMLVASDPDGDTLSFRIVAAPTLGVLELDVATGAFSYTGAANGVDSFAYVANDGQLDSNVATVTVEVGEGAALL